MCEFALGHLAGALRRPAQARRERRAGRTVMRMSYIALPELLAWVAAHPTATGPLPVIIGLVPAADSR